MAVGLVERVYGTTFELVQERCDTDHDDWSAYLAGVDPQQLAGALRVGSETALRTFALSDPAQLALQHWSELCVEELLLLAPLWSDADEYFAALELWHEASFDLFHELVAPSLDQLVLVAS